MRPAVLHLISLFRTVPPSCEATSYDRLAACGSQLHHSYRASARRHPARRHRLDPLRPGQHYLLDGRHFAILFAMGARRGRGCARRRHLRPDHRGLDGDHFCNLAAAGRDDRPCATTHAVSGDQHADLLRVHGAAGALRLLGHRDLLRDRQYRVPGRPAVLRRTVARGQHRRESWPHRRHRRRRRLSWLVSGGRYRLAARHGRQAAAVRHHRTCVFPLRPALLFLGP